MEIIPDPVHVILLTLPFIAAMVGGHVILWRPLLDWLDEREQTTTRARKEADELSAAADEQVARLEERLAAARQHTGQLRQEARGRALARETEIVSAARAEADSVLSAAIQEISGERQTASQALRDTASDLSTDIANQVLGRSVA